MQLIKTEQVTSRTTSAAPSLRPGLSVVQMNANGRQKLPRSKAVEEAAKRTG
ncbi:MAG: hypothetical protein V3U65_19225 [Granulosicoccaceae bacterium]